MSIEIWHNPRCSKSRQTLALLEEQGHSPSIRKYLEDPPQRAELERVANALGGARKLVRSKEAAFKERSLKEADDVQLIDAMLEEPKLIERPVVLFDGRAAIGRPPESVLELFSK